jgi:hypothetical protein
MKVRSPTFCNPIESNDAAGAARAVDCKPTKRKKLVNKSLNLSNIGKARMRELN